MINLLTVCSYYLPYYGTNCEQILKLGVEFEFENWELKIKIAAPKFWKNLENVAPFAKKLENAAPFACYYYGGIYE